MVLIFALQNGLDGLQSQAHSDALASIRVFPWFHNPSVKFAIVIVGDHDRSVARPYTILLLLFLLRLLLFSAYIMVYGIAILGAA